MQKKLRSNAYGIAIYIFPIELLIAEKEEVRSALAPFYGLADFIAALSVLFSIIIIVLVGIVRIERNKKHISFFWWHFVAIAIQWREKSIFWPNFIFVL